MVKFIEIINQVCKELNIQVNWVSKDYVAILKKDNQCKFITGYKFSNNDHAIGNILDDKFATCDVLNNFNIPVCEHKIFYNNKNQNDYAKDCNSYENLVEYFEKNNKSIVVKSNSGTCGNNVYRVNNIDELSKIYQKFENNYSYVACPYYNIITEYRAIVVNGKVMLLYGKVKPVVFGDGKSCIRELLLKFNPKFFKSIDLSDEKYNVILQQNEYYEYNWKFNLSQGANITLEIDKDVKDKILEIVSDVTSKLNIKFASIDTILTSDGNIRILEINSGVMMKNFIELYSDGENIAKNIYKEAIESLF